MTRIVVLVVVAAAAVASADTGGSVGGGNWNHSPTTTYTPPSHPDDFWHKDNTDTFGTTHIPVYTPPPIPHIDDTPHSLDDGAAPGSGYAIPIPTDISDDHDFLFDHFNLLFGAVALLIAGMWIKIAVLGDRPLRPDKLDRALAHVDDTDVTVLRVALDGRARQFVQGQMHLMGTTANASSDEGRVKLLRDVTTMVRRLRDAWVYGGADNEPIRDLENAKQAFDRHVDDARSRFREETLRNEQGVKTAVAASPTTPRADEGAGLILVSIIIAARQELFTVKKIETGDELRQALEAAGSLETWDLVAVEIVWQPTEETDRLSSMELEAKYPRPELVPIAGALVGKACCTFCGGPYPAELVSCPHCGAPARQAA